MQKCAYCGETDKEYSFKVLMPITDNVLLCATCIADLYKIVVKKVEEVEGTE